MSNPLQNVKAIGTADPGDALPMRIVPREPTTPTDPTVCLLYFKAGCVLAAKDSSGTETEVGGAGFDCLTDPCGIGIL